MTLGGTMELLTDSSHSLLPSFAHFEPRQSTTEDKMYNYINHEIHELQTVCNGIAQTANTLDSTPLNGAHLSQLASLSYELLSHISKIMKVKQQAEARNAINVHKSTKRTKDKRNALKKHKQLQAPLQTRKEDVEALSLATAVPSTQPQSGISTMFSILSSKNSKMGRSGQIHTCASCNTKACTQWLFAPNKLVLCNRCATKRPAMEAQSSEPGKISINSILN